MDESIQCSKLILRFTLKKTNPIKLFANNSRITVVITASTPWHEPPRLRHQLAIQMARFYNVLYIELPLSSTSRKEETEQISDNFIVKRFSKPIKGVGYLHKYIPLFHHLFNKWVVRKVNKTAGRYGGKKILINFQPDLPEIMESVIFSHSVYFCNDNFAGFQPNELLRKTMQMYEDRVLKRSNLCFTISVPLKDKCAQVSQNVELVFPGHSFSIPTSVDPVRKKTFPIKVMYMGYINNRLNAACLNAIADDSRIELVMIGPVQNEEVVAGLRERSNVTLHPPMTGKELQSKLGTADVLIMPYDTETFITQANYGSCPNKLMQYIACGKPVVSADIKNLINFPDYFIYKTTGLQEFVRAIFTAFEDDSTDKKQHRLRYASENTWDHRGEEINAVLIKNFNL